MEIIKLISPDYMNKLEVIRVANRGIVIKDNLVLLCYEEDDDQYIIPGGGLEDNETNIEGCIREVKEETGVIVNIKKEYLVIDEFFLNMEHINHYFICEVKEETMVPVKEEKTDILNINDVHDMTYDDVSKIVTDIKRDKELGIDRPKVLIKQYLPNKK
jgi:ADP-ribose pyrophosphatase YjhB (NUDIX family)